MGMQVPEVYECGQVTNFTIALVMDGAFVAQGFDGQASLTFGFSNGHGISWSLSS